MRRIASRLPPERGAKALAREVIDRASQVDVHEIRTARFNECRRPGHFVGVVAGELDTEERLLRGPPDQRELAPPALFQLPRHRHLAHRHARAELDAQLPVGQVGAFRHGRHDARAAQGFGQGHGQGTRDSGLGIRVRDSGFGVRDSGFGTSA